MNHDKSDIFDEDLTLQAAVRDALDAGEVSARVREAIHAAAEHSVRLSEEDERAIAPAVRDALDTGDPSRSTREAIHDAAVRETFARRRGTRLRFLNFVSTAAAAVIVASFCISLHLESALSSRTASVRDFERMDCLIDLVGISDPAAETEASADFTYDDWLAELNAGDAADAAPATDTDSPTPETLASRLDDLQRR